MTSPPVTDRSFGKPPAQVVKAVGVMAVLLVLAGLIAGAMWRRGKWFGHDSGAAWEYRPANAAAQGSHAGPAAPAPPSATLPTPGSMPETASATTPNLSSRHLRKPHAAIRLPLARPVPEDTASVDTPRGHRRHRHGFLGLGKIWHWIRRGHHKKAE